MPVRRASPDLVRSECELLQLHCGSLTAARRSRSESRTAARMDRDTGVRAHGLQRRRDRPKLWTGNGGVESAMPSDHALKRLANQGVVSCLAVGRCLYLTDLPAASPAAWTSLDPRVGSAPRHATDQQGEPKSQGPRRGCGRRTRVGRCVGLPVGSESRRRTPYGNISRADTPGIHERNSGSALI